MSGSNSCRRLRIAYIRVVGRYCTETLGPAFGRIGKLAHELNLFRPDTKCLGVYYDDPQVTPPKKQRADVGITVDESFRPTGDVQVQTIPGGPHAVLTHKGPYDTLSEAYRWIYAVWLPESGREPGEAACYEYYPQRRPDDSTGGAADEYLCSARAIAKRRGTGVQGVPLVGMQGGNAPLPAGGCLVGHPRKPCVSKRADNVSYAPSPTRGDHKADVRCVPRFLIEAPPGSRGRPLDPGCASHVGLELWELRRQGRGSGPHDLRKFRDDPAPAPHPLLLRNDFWRIRFAQWLAAIPDDASPDRLHELRGALARLMAWLRLAGQTELRSRLRDLRREVGAVRDLDVIHEQLGKTAVAKLARGSREPGEPLSFADCNPPPRNTSSRNWKKFRPSTSESARAAACGLFRKVRSAGKKLRNHPQPGIGPPAAAEAERIPLCPGVAGGEDEVPPSSAAETRGLQRPADPGAAPPGEAAPDGQGSEPSADDLEQCVRRLGAGCGSGSIRPVAEPRRYAVRCGGCSPWIAARMPRARSCRAASTVRRAGPVRSPSGCAGTPLESDATRETRGAGLCRGRDCTGRFRRRR